MPLRRLILLICFVLALLGFAPRLSHPSAAADDAARVEAIIAEMSLEQKVGQLFMVNIPGKFLTPSSADFIARFQPGAVALFSHNSDQDPAELARFINAMQQTAIDNGSVALFMATDQEGGLVQRLRGNGFTDWPDPLGYGAIQQAAPLIGLGEAKGHELAAVGFNMNLAPVLDLHSRADLLSDVRVMHRRTWGSDPAQVGWAAARYSDGLGLAGVVGVGKHYPGHGGAPDSHAGVARVIKPANEAIAADLRAFTVAVQEGLPAVMVGHLYYAAIEPQADLPATLSPTLLGLLRYGMGFEGVIMSDAMDMAAIQNTYYIPDAARLFIQAGGDLFVAGPFMDWGLLWQARAEIIASVERGDLSEDRIDASLRRMLSLKARHGLLDWSPLEVETTLERLDSQASYAALVEAYQAAATLIRDENGLFPLRPDDNAIIFYPQLDDEIVAVCRQIAPDLTYIGYVYAPLAWQLSQAGDAGRNYDKIVIFTRNAFFRPDHAELARRADPAKSLIIALDLPYDLELYPEASSALALYADLPASHEAACRVLFGQSPISGRLPIPIQGYPMGAGLSAELVHAEDD